MKKKMKTKTTTTSPSSLKTLINESSLFFDHLISLIPPQFLESADSADRPYYQGLSKAKKASLKKQSRRNLKLSRRNKFLPNPQPIPAPKPVPVPESDNNNINATPSLTYEELRQRLHSKIQSLKSNRNTRPIFDKPKPEQPKPVPVPETPITQVAAPITDTITDITFGKVKIGEETKKRKRTSKARELQKAEKMEELKRERPEIVEKQSWKKAERRAEGEKVHDDVGKLKEGLRKERKRKEKNKEEWKERLGKRFDVRREKQRTRTENIKERAEKKKAKKIERREKKLMRPGFEGRKEGYVNA